MARLQQYFDEQSGNTEDYSDPSTLFPANVSTEPVARQRYGGEAPPPTPTPAPPKPYNPTDPHPVITPGPATRPAPGLGMSGPGGIDLNTGQPIMTPVSSTYGGDPVALIRQWQQTHSASEPLTGLIDELKRNGISADAFMYGSTPSGNEITLNGQKYKVKTGDNNSWWDPSQGEGGGGGGEFTDPWGSTLESLTRGLIGSLTSPATRTSLDAYVSDLLANKELAKKRAADFAASMTPRVAQLRGPAYNEQQIAALKTGATDALERRRQETLKNEREKVYLRGFEPTSGLVQDAENQVNTRFDQARTQNESDLLRSEIDQTTANQRYADQLEQLITQALQGGDLASLESSASVADIENKRQQDDINRQIQAISAAQNPLALIASRLAGANSTLSLSNPSAGIASILQLMNQTNNSNITKNAAANQDTYALAQLLDILLGGGK